MNPGRGPPGGPGYRGEGISSRVVPKAKGQQWFPLVTFQTRIHSIKNIYCFGGEVIKRLHPPVLRFFNSSILSVSTKEPFKNVWLSLHLDPESEPFLRKHAGW